MKVIIDTNVLVSAALKDKDPEAVILFVAEQPDFDWIVSDDILTEYQGVLSRPKFNLPEDVRQRWLTLLDRLTTLIEVNSFFEFPRDQKDAKFLACALTANAEFSSPVTVISPKHRNWSIPQSYPWRSSKN